VRELRELVRYRAKLVALRTGLKAQVHAVLAKEGVRVGMSDLFGVGGQELLDHVPLGRAYAIRVESLRDVIEIFDREIGMLEGDVSQALVDHDGFRAIQTLRGVGPILAAVFVAEIGDVHRFRGAPQLCSWAGLTPSHHESDTTVRRGHITKQGSRLVRWAAVEAVQRQREGSPIAAHHHRVAGRRGKGVGRVAAARKLLTLVYYGLRDGEIRCLAKEAG
jgi:transposase